ncbi:MAG: hypothetical protein QXS37_00325, partial [Candidatus Aenigmatarchaeota archaeon]
MEKFEGNLKEKVIFSFSVLLITALIFNLAQGQDVFGQITSALKDYWGLIFILIFVLILLALGGVLKRPKGGMPTGLIIFIILIVLLFILPQFVPYPQYLEVPESFRYYKLPDPAVEVLGYIGIPRDWGYVPAIIYLFILPFTAIYTLVWAFLSSLKIFEGMPRVNVVLAFVITFMTIPMGWFVKMVWVLFSFVGAWSVAVFVAVFVLGIMFRGYGIVTGEYYRASARKWREEAKKFLRQAQDDLEYNREGSAINNLEAARHIAGFSQTYYTRIAEALNALQQKPAGYLQTAKDA